MGRNRPRVWGSQSCLRSFCLICLNCGGGVQSEECLQKTVETMKVLARNGEIPKFYLLTGGTMKEPARKLLGLRYCR